MFLLRNINNQLKTLDVRYVSIQGFQSNTNKSRAIAGREDRAMPL